MADEQWRQEGFIVHHGDDLDLDAAPAPEGALETRDVLRGPGFGIGRQTFQGRQVFLHSYEPAPRAAITYHYHSP